MREEWSCQTTMWPLRTEIKLLYAWSLEWEGRRRESEAEEIGGGQASKHFIQHAKQFMSYPKGSTTDVLSGEMA